ncbi:hypothetical protein [Pseudomonas sp.]|uniref:hypothetical protein n=1 Tax=Pseudomonas sp. TaxID=306 RepID=UPI00258B28E4|nr:hypothetical protein [Pseudomonas sp.]
MISTTVSGICGGAFVVRWLGIRRRRPDRHQWADLSGACWFKWAEKRRDKDLGEMTQDLAEIRRNLNGANQ